MNQFKTIDLNVKLQTWAIALICFSYPISIVVFIKLGIPTGPANIALKALFTILAVISFFLIPGSKIRSINLILLVGFFTLYGIRLLYDTATGISNAYYSNSYIYLYYFILTVFPCLILIWGRGVINVNYLLRIIFIIIALSNIAYFYYSMTQVAGSFTEQLAGRINVESANVDNVYTTIINPISVGRFGALLSLISFYKILFSPKEILSRDKIIWISLFILGVANILLSSSRGPLIAFILFLIIILYSYFKSRKLNAALVSRLVISTIAILILFIYYLAPIISSTEIFLFQRVEMIFENINNGGIKEARNYSFESAFNDFVDSPLLGKQFVGTYDNFYPHNILLEILMSVGIVGGFLFFKPLISLIIYYRELILHHSNIFIIYTVGFCLFFLSLTSGSIYTNPELWIFSTLLIILRSEKYRQSTN